MGQAKNRGTFEERRAQAIAAGRKKTKQVYRAKLRDDQARVHDERSLFISGRGLPSSRSVSMMVASILGLAFSSR